MRPNQEVFDEVCSFLLKQGAKSLVPGMCSYATEDGRKCAVGCLIPEGFYKPIYEGQSVMSLADNYPELMGAINVDLELLQALQAAHDTSSALNFVTEFKVAARYVANTFHLNKNVLDAQV